MAVSEKKALELKLGVPREHHETIESTNRRALELAAAGASAGTLVTASQQTEGHGRAGRPWISPPGTSLSMSLVLHDPSPVLSLAAGVAVAKTIDHLLEDQPAHHHAMIKWPADIMLDGGKVAGILVEGVPQKHWAVLGIGINVATRLDALPAEAREHAATLGLAPSDIDRVQALLLEYLGRWLMAEPERVVRAARERDALRGQHIRWADGSGTAAGIDLDGHLLVDLGDGVEESIEAGEVHIVTH